MDSSRQSFLARNDFLIRRLHSLCGLIPVGAYMVVHLIVNSSVINGAATFQNNVLNIHKLGALLPLVEWTFIFIPILFHMIFGFVIIAGGMPNPHNYPLRRQLSLHAATRDRHDRGGVHRDPRLPHAWLDPQRIVAPLRRRAARRRPVPGLQRHQHRRPGAAERGDGRHLRHRHHGLRLSPGQRHLDDGDHLGRLDQPAGAAAGVVRLHAPSAC